MFQNMENIINPIQETDRLTVEDGTDRISQIISTKIILDAAWKFKKAQISKILFAK
jgi:hypothetical protein